MPEPLEFNPLVVDNVKLTLDGVDYATALDSVILVPTTTKAKFVPVNGRTKNRVPKPSWALTLNLGQDFDKSSLSAQLIERHGEQVPFILEPEGEGSTASKITGIVTLEAGQLGGAAAAVATASVTLDVDEQPAFTWRTATTAG